MFTAGNVVALTADGSDSDEPPLPARAVQTVAARWTSPQPRHWTTIRGGLRRRVA